MRWGTRASFVVEGVEAMRAFLEDRDSMATRELKARARAKGISSGRLWKVRAVLLRPEDPHRLGLSGADLRVASCNPGVLYLDVIERLPRPGGSLTTRR
jgi:hypothetical protein